MFEKKNKVDRSMKFCPDGSCIKLPPAINNNNPSMNSIPPDETIEDVSIVKLERFKNVDINNNLTGGSSSMVIQKINEVFNEEYFKSVLYAGDNFFFFSRVVF